MGFVTYPRLVSIMRRCPFYRKRVIVPHSLLLRAMVGTHDDVDHLGCNRLLQLAVLAGGFTGLK